jgi:hypothetical protein
MRSKRRRRRLDGRARSRETGQRGEAVKDHPQKAGRVLGKLTGWITSHKRLVLVSVAATAGLLLANIGLGLGLTSKFWKLASRLPGAGMVSRSAVLAKAITAPEDQLEEVLASAKAVLDEALTQGLALDETLVLDAGTRAISVARHRPRLVQIGWQTASAAISYGSAQSVSFKLPMSVPDCFATQPQWVLAKDITATDTVIPVRPIYSSCKLELDLAPGRGKTRAYEHGLTCRECVVTYSGGPLAVASPQFTFQDSVFVFSINSEPLPAGRVLTETLLASKFQQAET